MTTHESGIDLKAVSLAGHSSPLARRIALLASGGCVSLVILAVLMIELKYPHIVGESAFIFGYICFESIFYIFFKATLVGRFCRFVLLNTPICKLYSQDKKIIKPARQELVRIASKENLWKYRALVKINPAIDLYDLKDIMDARLSNSVEQYLDDARKFHKTANLLYQIGLTMEYIKQNSITIPQLSFE